MRLWPQQLIPYLDRQRLLGQHRECCALRGKGWGRKHATVDYVFKHDPSLLVAYHWLVMDEMERRGYHPDRRWRNSEFRGDSLAIGWGWADADYTDDQYCYATHKNGIIYPEHNQEYLDFCLDLLKQKGAPINYDEIH